MCNIVSQRASDDERDLPRDPARRQTSGRLGVRDEQACGGHDVDDDGRLRHEAVEASQRAGALDQLPLRHVHRHRRVPPLLDFHPLKGRQEASYIPLVNEVQSVPLIADSTLHLILLTTLM